MKTLQMLEVPIDGIEPGKYKGCTAIPIKAPKENTSLKISPLFGEVKFFAFYDRSSKTIETFRNPVERGGMVVNMLLKLGVRDLIVLHMGQGAYMKAISNDMKVYFAEDDKISFDELLRKYDSNELTPIIPDKFELLTRFSCHNNH